MLITGTGFILLFNTKVPQNDQIYLNKLEKLNKQTLTLFSDMVLFIIRGFGPSYANFK